MANSWPQNLPDWQVPLQDEADDLYIYSKTDVGPGIARKRYTGKSRNLNPTMNVTGAQRATLDAFYDNNVKFEREDPKDDTLQTFRFTAPPRYQMTAGAENPNDRQYSVTLNVKKLP